MRIMSLQQFVRQAREPQDIAPQEVLTMSVRNFIDAIETNYEDDCIAEVTLNSPEPDSISVKFFPSPGTHGTVGICQETPLPWIS